MSLFIHWNMKFNIISLANQLILCSEWVPSEWEFKQLIKTSAWSTSKQYLICAHFTPDSDEATFSLVLEKAILWTEDSYFNWKQWIEVKTITSWMFITNMQIFPWQEVKWWTEVILLSAVWILVLTAPIHCRGSTGDHFGWTIPSIKTVNGKIVHNKIRNEH